MNKQNYLGEKNKYFKHLLNHKTFYLTIFAAIIFLYITIINFISEKTTIMGAESYFYLSNPSNIFNPWNIIIKTLPNWSLFLIAPSFIIISIILFIRFAKNIKLSDRFTFIFLAFLIVTPTFIFTATTISSYSLFLLLVIAGSVLLTEKNKRQNYISPIFFLLASFFDLLNTLIVIIILVNLLYYNKKEQVTKISLILVTISSIINFILLKQPIILGPFQSSNLIIDLITDLGGTSGIGFFIILLSIFGITVTWKRKKLYSGYIFLPILIITYILNTQTIFLLSIVIVLFASVGFIKLFEWRWNLVDLKKYTLLLLILGIIFSTLTFLDRIEENGPFNSDKETLTWIKDNTEKNTTIISSSENSYFINHFSKRESFNYPHLNNKLKTKITKNILNSTYVSELFPLLEDNKISIIYITKEMKKNLPKAEDQGLLFLLRNERFKLVHSSENSEVWLFKKIKKVEE